MTFKNKRGEVSWYVVGIILALIVLVIAIGAVLKIKAAQENVDGQQSGLCESVAGGTCQAATECGAGFEKVPLVSCPEEGQICCKAS